MPYMPTNLCAVNATFCNSHQVSFIAAVHISNDSAVDASHFPTV